MAAIRVLATREADAAAQEGEGEIARPRDRQLEHADEKRGDRQLEEQDQSEVVEAFAAEEAGGPGGQAEGVGAVAFLFVHEGAGQAGGWRRKARSARGKPAAAAGS